MAAAIGRDDVFRVDVRVATIAAAEPFPRAREPAFKPTIDLGPLGIRRSSALITEHDGMATLIGHQVAAVVNLPPRQIGPTMGEGLTLGFPDANGPVALIAPNQSVPNGGSGIDACRRYGLVQKAVDDDGRHYYTHRYINQQSLLHPLLVT